MIKLTDLLNEVKIVPPTDKGKLLNDIANFDIYLLSSLTYSNTLEEFLDDNGYNDMEGYILDGDISPEHEQYIYSYYTHIKPGDVFRVGKSAPVAGYKMVRSWGFDYNDEDDLILLTKF